MGSSSSLLLVLRPASARSNAMPKEIFEMFDGSYFVKDGYLFCSIIAKHFNLGFRIINPITLHFYTTYFFSITPLYTISVFSICPLMNHHQVNFGA